MNGRTVLVLTLMLSGFAQPSRAQTDAGSLEARPLRQLPYTPGLDTQAMNRTADACSDFYEFACGGWTKRNPIPADQASWSVYGKLANENQQFLWGLLESASTAKDSERTAEEQKIGDYFSSCMSEETIDQAGFSPLEPELAAIEQLKSKKELARHLGRLHNLGVNGALFGFGSMQSFDDSTQMVPIAAADGLGLPDRDQYLASDDRAKDTRAKYLAHIGRLMELSGLSKSASARNAATVLRIETALAKSTLTRVDRRDPKKIWHHTLLADLKKITPSFQWKEYLAEVGTPEPAWLNVTEPQFFKAVEKQLVKEDLNAWKIYLRWHTLHARAPYLSKAFVAEHFTFNQAHLRGVKELSPRWKRCVAWVDRDLGEALGKVFVKRAMPAGVKEQTEELVRQTQLAMKDRLKNLTWMGPETRKIAFEKLASMRNKVGFPTRWRDYSELQVTPGDFLGNVKRASHFEQRRQLAKIGKPVDRDEWAMSPPSVNAYYDPSMNEMNFPAGVLLPPLWDPKMDLAPGYGNTGGTVGHELVHGFDDEGRKFDPQGNLRDWWSAADEKQFESRAQCVADQYAQYPVVDDLKINSRLTLGEDIADLGGTVLAYWAWKNVTQNQKLAPIDGLTPDQRYFVGFAQWACANERPEILRLRALTDPHSPARWRINGVVANMPEFAAAFSCKAGQPMVKEKPCLVW